MEEMTIDLKDLFRRILMKWRQLLVCMLICAVVLTVFGGVKSFLAAEDAKAKLEAQIAAGGPAEGEQAIVVPAVEWVSATNVILGAVLGVIVMCCIVGVPYLFAKSLRVKDDLKDVFHVTLLGSFRRSKYKKHIFDQVDRWINGWFYPKRDGFSKTDQIQMICTDVKLMAQKNQMKRVYLTGACNDAETEKLKAQFCEKLQDELEHISCGKSVAYDPKSLESLVEADGVVLFERVDVSAYADIEKELEYCKRYGVPVIGCVVVE